MLTNIWFKRWIMFLLVCAVMFLLGAPNWGQFGIAIIVAYLAFPESRSFHIATSKIVQYSIGYNFPKHGNPGDLFHKVDEDAVYRMDASGEWKLR